MKRQRAIERIRRALDLDVKASDADSVDADRRFVLQGRVTLTEAGHMRQRLMSAIDGTQRDGYLLVDLGGVEEMDTAALAVLVEGIAAGKERHRPVVVCGPSERLLDLFRLTGLEGSICNCGSCREEAERLQLALAS